MFDPKFIDLLPAITLEIQTSKTNEARYDITARIDGGMLEVYYWITVKKGDVAKSGKYPLIEACTDIITNAMDSLSGWADKGKTPAEKA